MTLRSSEQYKLTPMYNYLKFASKGDTIWNYINLYDT